MNTNLELQRVKDKLAEAQEFQKKAQFALDIAMVTLNMVLDSKTLDMSPVPAKTEIVVKPAVIEPLVVTPEWSAILDALNDPSRKALFVTGGAGVGKSTLLKEYTDKQFGDIAIVAPTGRAAILVGGSTIHRFFSFGAHALTEDDIPSLSDTRKEKYRALRTLVIEEVSMVRADMIDAIDRFLRKNGRDKTLPFGGTRIVMFGDPYQLPPVSREAQEKKWLMSEYGTETPYFFHAHVWQTATLETKQLTTIFRQKDDTFTGALNAIRNGTTTDDHLALINSRVQPRFKPPTGELWITLTTTNAHADQANQTMLNAINAPAKTFVAIVGGDFDLHNAPTDEMLVLKPGAAVMFIRNDFNGNWQNGTLGKVVSTTPLRVEIKGVNHDVEPVEWENIEYQFDEKSKKLTKRVKGTFEQVPLKLAAAMTIHKGQGLSMDNVILDFGNGAFAAGQAYVGLSRCRTLEGMVLRQAVQKRDLIVSTEVQNFLNGEPIAHGWVPQPTLIP